MSPATRIVSTASQRELIRILGMAYGGEPRAVDAVSRAVADSNLSALPDGAAALYEFVAREMVPVLTEDLGPRMTIALLAELETFRDKESSLTLAAASKHPVSEAPVTGPRRRRPSDSEISAPRSSPSRMRALVVDGDRLRRANTSRALIRAKCDVTAVESAAELRSTLMAEGGHDIAVVDLGTSAAVEILDVFATLEPALPLVVCAPDPDAVNRVLAARRVKTFVACNRSAAPDDVATIATSYLAHRKDE